MDPQNFDLVEENNKAWRMNRMTIAANLGIGVAFLLMGTYLLVETSMHLSAHGGLTSSLGLTFLALALFLEFIAAFAFLATTQKLPGADMLRLLPDGVELWSGSRLRNSWRWDVPANHAVLVDCSKSPSVGVEDHPFFFMEDASSFPRQNAITREAFEAVLLSAQQAGAAVTTHLGSPRSYTYPVTIYDIVGTRPSRASRPG